MKKLLIVTLALLAHSAMCYAGDTSTPLDDDRINIRSMLDPDIGITKQDPVAIDLPANPTIADKQLQVLLSQNLTAAGINVTSVDKSKWTIIASVKDQSSTLTYYKNGFFSPSTIVATTDYATLTVVICKSADLNTPVWLSSVYTLNDYWVNNEEDVVEAIVATYGANFYYLDVDPTDVPKYVRKNKSQPSMPTPEDIQSRWQEVERCNTSPAAKGC